MSDLFKPRVGGILSADIAVPEHEREVHFYSRVLNTGKKPFWRDDLMNNRGIPVIGLGPREGEYAELPLQWMPHIQVADVATSVKQALDLGGTKLMHAKDGDGTSQWAVLLDPNGAAFGIIPVVSPEATSSGEAGSSAEDPESAGRIAWVDLTVSDASHTQDFYRQVIGWSIEEIKMEESGASYVDYNLLGGDGEPSAGICHAQGVNAGLPPVWMIYLPVGDLTESLRRVEEEGGKILKASRGDDGEYESAVIQDPVGVCLTLVAG